MRGSNVSRLTIRPFPQQGHIRGSIPVSLVNNSSQLSGAAGSGSSLAEAPSSSLQSLIFAFRFRLLKKNKQSNLYSMKCYRGAVSFNAANQPPTLVVSWICLVGRCHGISGLVRRLHSFFTGLAFYCDLLAFYLALCSLFGK